MKPSSYTQLVCTSAGSLEVALQTKHAIKRTPHPAFSDAAVAAVLLCSLLYPRVLISSYPLDLCLLFTIAEVG